MEEAKLEYDLLLKRYEKATMYFERTDIPQREKEKFLNEFQDILTKLNYYQSKLEVYTNQIRMEGVE